jgi:hypothetical protein
MGAGTKTRSTFKSRIANESKFTVYTPARRHWIFVSMFGGRVTINHLEAFERMDGMGWDGMGFGMRFFFVIGHLPILHANKQTS